MDTLLNNKSFIRVSIACVTLLSLFIISKTANEVLSAKSIAKGQPSYFSISVTGEADALAKPDIANIDFSVSKEAKTSGEASTLLNTSVSSVLAYIKSQGIEDKDVKSTYGGVTPKYSNDYIVCIAYPCNQKEPKIVGYIATQSVSIKVRKTDNANQVVYGLSALNAGTSVMSGPYFSIDDPSVYKTEARTKAIADAKTRAEQIAKDLGVKLVKVTSYYEEVPYDAPMMYEAKAMDSSMGSAAPVLPVGETKIHSKVNVTYEIE